MDPLGRLALVLVVALAAAPAAGAVAGDPRAGEALFVGARPLVAGGAPCLACHALAGHGLGWEASFGPDLSEARQTYDAEALEAILADVPFPSMVPLYRGHAITAPERADLAAFLLEARTGGRPADPRWTLALEAGVGAAVLLAGLVLLDRRRMRPVKDALARRRTGGPS